MKSYFKFTHRNNPDFVYAAQYDDEYNLFTVMWKVGEDLKSYIQKPSEVKHNLGSGLWKEVLSTEECIQGFYNR